MVAIAWEASWRQKPFLHCKNWLWLVGGKLNDLLLFSPVENNIMAKGVLAILLALRETSCPVRLLDLSCTFFICSVTLSNDVNLWIGNNLTDDGAKYLINFLNGKSKTDLAIILLHRNQFTMIPALCIENDIAFCIADLQSALNRRKIQSPKLREQWM